MKSSENESSNSSDTIPQENGINNSHILLLDRSAISVTKYLSAMIAEIEVPPSFYKLLFSQNVVKSR